jgi:hypothetical protein
MTIGEITERLIYIKDNYGIEDRDDIEALNHACNLINKQYDRLSVAEEILYPKEK